MNWKQKIEAQIADLYPEQFEQRESMQALLDVAVAAEDADLAEAFVVDGRGYGQAVVDALDKLREVSE